ncbi:MAG: GH39 family glycosyl hydrolase [Terriglobia bacterium]
MSQIKRRKRASRLAYLPVLAGVIFLSGGISRTSAQSPQVVSVNWDKVTGVSKTEASFQVVVNPPMRRGTAIHDEVFESLKNLQCDHVRYVPWLPYPRLGVAELEPPRYGKTSWDFSLIDPMTADFMNATSGHSVIMNFSTIPQWMFKTGHPVSYPADPDHVFWSYTQGTTLRDPSMKEVADYYARLVSWYTQGGFTDEFGQRHESGYHYKIDYWEALNEVDFEHKMTPEFYTALYDAIVTAIHKVDPRIKFVGMALAAPGKEPDFFEYFLNPKNHQPGVPLDMISYHFYANPTPDQKTEDWQYTFFDQADGFLNVVRYVESIRKRLSPGTQTDLDELGAILPNDNSVPRGAIPKSYWNLCGAMYAYLYVQTARLGIDVVGESQLVGYPTQFPSVSMLDWNTGKPNPRYWVLKLIHDNFGPGDKLVESHVSTPSVEVQGFITRAGKRKILLINKRQQPVELSLPSATGARMEYVDPTTGFDSPSAINIPRDEVTLNPFAVEVVTLAH